MPGSNSRPNVSEGNEVPLSYRGDRCDDEYCIYGFFERSRALQLQLRPEASKVASALEGSRGFAIRQEDRPAVAQPPLPPAESPPMVLQPRAGVPTRSLFSRVGAPAESGSTILSLESIWLCSSGLRRHIGQSNLGFGVREERATGGGSAVLSSGWKLLHRPRLQTYLVQPQQHDSFPCNTV